MRNRTIKIKVAEVIEPSSKSEFHADLRSSLELSRRAANKSVTLCLKTDEHLMQNEKCPKLYTYPIVASCFPGVASAASTICREVERKYKQRRWHYARGFDSAALYRSFPWPLLSNKSTNMLNIEDHGEFLTARIKLRSGWWTVRLAGGSNYRDQIRGIRAAIENGKICDSKIWVDKKHHAMIGVSVSLPDTELRGTSGTLNVSSGRTELIVATKQRNDTPFVITGDEVKKWIAERDRRYQRLSQDRKSGKSRSAIKAIQKQVGDKWRQRLDSFTHETASKIVAHAKRRRVSVVSLDLTIKSFFSKFPWHELATKIAYKCEDTGIEFVNATQTITQPDLAKPHVYFKFSPDTGRVKIGQTSVVGGSRHKGKATDSPDRNLVILAIDNQPKNKTKQREKHFHAMFAAHRLDSGEWFEGEPILHWLREAEWLGNAGNLSQIAQVLPSHWFETDTPTSEVSASVPEPERKRECSQKAVKSQGYSRSNATAPETINQLVEC